MLFSREDVSAYLTQHFEPAWEMVREVPLVRIDFGNNRVVTRTLHGNVASYVCLADGHVMDVLPGIYTPDRYTAALGAPLELARQARGLTDANARLQQVRTYHQLRAEALRTPAQPGQEAPAPNGPGRPVPNRERDVGKKTVERPIERLIIPNRPGAAQGPRPRTAAELAAWQPLVADTAINESQGRLQIHTHLSNARAIQPEQIKRWLYREVLHADLDDPNLGLGDDFFTAFER